MELFSQKNKAWAYTLIILSAFVLLAIGALIGTWFSKDVRHGSDIDLNGSDGVVIKQLENEASTEKAENTKYKNVVRRIEYLRCGHIHELPSIEREMTREELEKQYSGYKVIIVNGENAVLRKEVAEYCPLHYVLKQNGDALTVERCSAESGELETIRTIEIEASALPESARKEMGEGLPFEELAQIDEYMENMES